MRFGPVKLLFALAICMVAVPVLALEVALIGDGSKRTAIKQLAGEFRKPASRAGGLLHVTVAAPASWTFTSTDGDDSPVAIANQVFSADVALLVVDATQGPLPVVREHLIIARQARIPALAVYFSNVRQLLATAPKDAADLLALEQAEMEELLKKYEMNRDVVALYDRDVSRILKATYPRGTADLRRYLGSASRSRPVLPAMRSLSRFNCYYYLLAEKEANGRSATLRSGDQLVVWTEGRASGALVKTSKVHSPGGTGEFDLLLPSPLRAAAGSRVLLIKGGATIGVGVVKAIIQ